MKRPEDKFIFKIKEVFENYQDDSANFGWEQLEKISKKQPERPFILWLNSVAAILLLVFGVWFLNSRIDTTNTVVKKKHSDKKESPLIVPSMKQMPENVAKIIVERPLLSQSKFSHHGKKGTGGTSPDLKEFINSSKRIVGIIAVDQSNNSLTLRAGKIDSLQIQNERAFSSNLKNVDTTFRIQEPTKQGNKKVVLENTFPKTFNESLEVDQTANRLGKITPTKKMTPDKGSKAIALSVYAGTHFNYSKGSENNFNLGFGLSSDIKLTKKLKLSTGIALAQNTLKYTSNSSLPTNSASAFISTLNSASKGVMDSYPTSQGGFAAATTASEIEGFKASLLSLDIPVNIKYQVLSNKNKLYVSTGFSSGTYLNEVYSYTYNKAYAAGNTIILDSKGSDISSKSSNNFYLAKTLNISAGLSTPLTKTQDLTIEPFLKYPLGGLGEQHIKFGAAGINLKLNFNTSSKK